MSSFEVPTEEVSIARSVDVLVAGGGSAGCTAAIAAARRGLRTVLVEDMPFLGGMSTGGAVGTYCGFHRQETDGAVTSIVGGLPLEIAQTLVERGQAYGPIPFRDTAAMPYVPWGVKRLLEERVWAEENLELWLHARLTHALTDGGRIRGVVVQTRSGRVAFEAGVFIDATGDAELVRACGLPVDRYDERQYPSMMFTMQNVDAARALGDPARLGRILEEGHAKDGLPRRGGNLIPTGRPGEVLVALSRVSIGGRPIDASDARELTRGEIEGRAQAEELAEFLKARVPGFEEAYLVDTAARLGVRETVHVRGHTQLTRDDVLSLRKFPDGIGRSAWPIELHVEGGETVWEFLPRGEHYTIPYSALVPEGISNLLAVGRCISATREGFASVRVIGPCMLEGQAAGVAAEEALARDAPFGDLDVDRLRSRLSELGVPL